MENEKWLPVIGFESEYEVSDFGRIKSLARTIVRGHNVKYYTKEFIMKPHFDTKGYSQINFKGKYYSVHRLVAKHFIPNPQNLTQVNHKLGIKSDNRASELEWCEQSYNMKEAFRLGLNKPHSGEKNWKAKFEMDDIFDMRYLQAHLGLSTIEISRIYKVSYTIMWKILTGKTYKNNEITNTNSFKSFRH